MLVDANQHVDREGAARAGLGFYGKNTLLITRKHGSWVVLGTLVTDVEIEPSPPLELDCGSCTLCIEACPTGALDEPGVVDSTRCLSYWTQSPEADPGAVPRGARRQVYGCDICQDVCPWNRGIEKRRAGEEPPPAPSRWSRCSTGCRRPDEELGERYDRLYFPRNDPRYLRRNALVAAGNSGETPGGSRAPVCRGRRPAAPRARRVGARATRREEVSTELERLRRTEIWIAWVRLFAVPFAAFEVAIVG